MIGSGLTGKEWSLDDAICYLNHAAVAPWPVRTQYAVCEFAKENATMGAKNYPKWEAVESRLRHKLATLINAPSIDDIALLKNTSEALSVVAYGLEWETGQNIVISNQEFPSNRIVWESLADQGVQLKQVDLLTNSSPEDALIAACDEHTRLLSISSVQYVTGLRMDLKKLGDHCRANNILFCVDAIQSLGALPFDVEEIGADFVAADGHKWLLAPEGVALFYCRNTIRDRLALKQYGWHMVAERGNYDKQTWEIASSAQRFECGSPNMLGIHGMEASVTLLLEIGIDQIATRLLERSEYLVSKLKELDNCQIITSDSKNRLAGIITFCLADIDHRKLFRHLMSRNVICAQRGGGIRFSPHYYTPISKLDYALDLVREYAQ